MPFNLPPTPPAAVRSVQELDAEIRYLRRLGEEQSAAITRLTQAHHASHLAVVHLFTQLGTALGVKLEPPPAPSAA